MKRQGIQFWANIATKMTIEAANVKDWRLRSKSDKHFKVVANELANGRGYVIATDWELAKQYPTLFDPRTTSESKKMIWSVRFNRLSKYAKMSFCPIY